MRIVVLGATGFIGCNMTRHFAAQGHQVQAIRFTRPTYEMENVEWTHCDLRQDSYTLKTLMEDADIVIHAAATTSGSRDIVNTPWMHVTDNAVMGSRIFRAAFEAKVKHVIFFSCSTMFSSGHVIEESPIDIHPKYFGVAQTKLYLEKLCEFYSGLGTTKYTAIRHSNIYGPHDKFDLERSHFFGATVTKVTKATDKITVWGTGEEKRDLMHVDDLCAFVDAALEKQLEKFALYNAGYGVALSVNDVVAKIIAVSGKPLTIEHDLSAPTIRTSLSMDCDKAWRDLGWNPKVTIDDGIKQTMEWYKENIAA